MNRLTVKQGDRYVLSQENLEAVLARLGTFEDAFEALQTGQAQIPKELERMRLEGKEKTVRYKETMGQKLLYQQMTLFFEQHGVL